MNIYVDLTQEFNAGALRAILSSGQAVVLHRLAIMSKDGDWILRETPDALEHVLHVLAQHGARYRFGAPLDVRWMQGGWSAHFQFQHAGLRVRCDFVTRPPRLDPEDLACLWQEQAHAAFPFVDARRLVELKKTNRDKDYAVIGELARLLADPRQQLLASRSAQDLMALAGDHAALARELEEERPVLQSVREGIAELEAALDAERRALIHANERRLGAFLEATEEWSSIWPEVQREVAGLPLLEAHRRITDRAAGVLPVRIEGREA